MHVYAVLIVIINLSVTTNLFWLALLLAMKVAFQSPTSLRVAKKEMPYPLFSIASNHNLATIYKWKCLETGCEDVLFPSSPVIYAPRRGLYQCIMMSADKKEKVEAGLIQVDFLDEGYF